MVVFRLQRTLMSWESQRLLRTSRSLIPTARCFLPMRKSRRWRRNWSITLLRWPRVSYAHSGRTLSTQIRPYRGRRFPVFDCTNGTFISNHSTSTSSMKAFFHSRVPASKGAALIIVLALVVLLTGFSLAYFSRTTNDRQLAQSSSNDTTADLLARSALGITVSDFKQEILSPLPVTAANIQPSQYGVPPITDPTPIPNLIRRSFSGAPQSRASIVSSGAPSANGRSISLARWNSHYLAPRASTTNNIDSTPVSSFAAPDWVLVTAQGPNSAPSPNAVIGRYAFAVYDEGGLIDMNLGGFPTYAGLSRPTRRPATKRPSEESEIMFATCQVPNFTPQVTNANGNTGALFSLTPNTNQHPTSFGPDTLPHGLFLNPITGNIFGIPTSPGSFTVTLSASNNCGTGYGTLYLTIDGLPSPSSTPWPVNLARKGTVAFADVTTLPSTPTVITPTTLAGSMGG